MPVAFALTERTVCSSPPARFRGADRTRSPEALFVLSRFGIWALLVSLTPTRLLRCRRATHIRCEGPRPVGGALALRRETFRRQCESASSVLPPRRLYVPRRRRHSPSPFGVQSPRRPSSSPRSTPPRASTWSRPIAFLSGRHPSYRSWRRSPSFRGFPAGRRALQRPVL